MMRPANYCAPIPVKRLIYTPHYGRFSKVTEVFQNLILHPTTSGLMVHGGLLSSTTSPTRHPLRLVLVLTLLRMSLSPRFASRHCFCLLPDPLITHSQPPRHYKTLNIHLQRQHRLCNKEGVLESIPPTTTHNHAHHHLLPREAISY